MKNPKLPARKDIRDLKPYETGKPIKELERETGIQEADIIKLASNENPIGPSPKAVRAVLRYAGSINRYPDGSCFYIKKRLASLLGLASDNIVLGNGSDELIDIIIKAFLNDDEEALVSKPAFLEYAIIAKTHGIKIKAVPMDGPAPFKKGSQLKRFSYNIDRVLGAIGNKTKLIFLGNPDNPTGAYLGRDEFRRLLKGCPQRVIIVIDEAYREFVDKKDYPDPASYIDRRNIIVLRTFSKAYGLAGLRIGYAVTNRDLAGWMERVRLPFNVNMLAQVAAEAALDDKVHIRKTVKLVRKGKRFLIGSLRKTGFGIIEGPANFMLISYKGIDGASLFRRLLARGVIIRDMKAYGLEEWARVNVGTMPENKRLIRTLKEVVASLKTINTITEVKI